MLELKLVANFQINQIPLERFLWQWNIEELCAKIMDITDVPWKNKHIVSYNQQLRSVVKLGSCSSLLKAPNSTQFRKRSRADAIIQMHPPPTTTTHQLFKAAGMMIFTLFQLTIQMKHNSMTFQNIFSKIFQIFFPKFSKHFFQNFQNIFSKNFIIFFPKFLDIFFQNFLNIFSKII